MEDPENLVDEYRERNVRWTTESLKQLSFYNNLLLTLSVGFLSFSFKPNNLNEIYFTLGNVDWSLKALEYSLKRWKELSLFTTDGQLEIDNKKIENDIRHIARQKKLSLRRFSRISTAHRDDLLAARKLRPMESIR